MLRAVMLALLLAGCAALAGPASAADYGRWRVTVSGHVGDSWTGSSTASCAISGHGGADLDFTTAQAVTVHLRRVRVSRREVVWRLARRAILRLNVHGTVSGDAQRQPPPSPDDTCAWPDPATWACGPLEYSARQELLAGATGLGLQDSHYFEFPPDVHEPEGRACGVGQAGSGINLPIAGPQHGSTQPFYRLRRASVAARRRIVIHEHADASATPSYDNNEQPPFELTDDVARDTTIVLTPV
jgi:hypothetical protein